MKIISATQHNYHNPARSERKEDFLKILFQCLATCHLQPPDFQVPGRFSNRSEPLRWFPRNPSAEADGRHGRQRGTYEGLRSSGWLLARVASCWPKLWTQQITFLSCESIKQRAVPQSSVLEKSCIFENCQTTGVTKMVQHVNPGLQKKLFKPTAQHLNLHFLSHLKHVKCCLSLLDVHHYL